MANIATDARTYATKASAGTQSELKQLQSTADGVATARYFSSASTGRTGYNDFSETDLREVLQALNSVLDVLPLGSQPSPVSEDAPIPFDVDELPDHLDRIAANSPVGQTAQFVATLSMRIRMMLADQRLGPVVDARQQQNSVRFEEWLEAHIGADGADNGQLAIIDLSLVPSDVLHIVIAVTARIIFEATQRYRRINTQELPTVLVLEEAHTFVNVGGSQEAGNPTPEQMCRETFERIAREGRKFGLGLVLASQRPSELSPTVLAQCNTFLLHRIVNDRDQTLVGRLMPDNLGRLLEELPSLPSQQAILLGWATEVPVLVEITELRPEHRPNSSDPKFWEVWTGTEEREINWPLIVDEWTGQTTMDRPDTTGEIEEEVPSPD